MPMREQNVIQSLEADTSSEDLPLRALAAIDHEAVFVVLDHQRGKPPA